VTDSPDFATKPTLRGARAVLRPFTEADLPAMREALLDPEARILTGSVHDEAAAHAPESPDEERMLRDWYLTRNEHPHRAAWTRPRSRLRGHRADRRLRLRAPAPDIA
jgi:RimJ/RimL family protein N-acetyltransferase